MKGTIQCSSETDLIFKLGNSCVLLFGALYGESRYVKIYIFVSL